MLWLLVALALAAAVPALVERVRSESASCRVEVAMDLDLIDILARSQGSRTDAVLAEFARAGLGAVAWTGTTLDRLSLTGVLTVYEGRELASLIAAGAVAAPDLLTLDRQGFFQSSYTYAYTTDPSVGQWLEKAAATYLPEGRQRVVRLGSLTVLETTLLKERAVQLRLGLLPDELVRSGVAGVGLRVIVRPPNLAATVGPEGVADVEADLLDLAANHGVTWSLVAFSATEVLGYPGNLDQTVAMVKRLGAPVAVFETSQQLGNVNQKGIGYVAGKLDYQVVRIYSALDIKVLSPAELAQKVVNPVRERGLRVVYLHPFLVVPERLLTTEGVTRDGRSVYEPPPGAQIDYSPLLALNVNYVRDVVSALRSEGFEFGVPEPLSGPKPPTLARTALLALGAAAGLALAWLAVRPRGRFWLAGGLAASALVPMAVVVMVATGRGSLGLQLAALAAALAFPSLALSRLAASWTGVPWAAAPAGDPAAAASSVAEKDAAPARNVWAAVACDLLVVSGISLAGGLLVAAILADIRFMLEFEYFRGVKLTYLVPLLAGLVYWLRYRYPEESEPRAWPRVLLRAAAWHIRVWHVVSASVLGVGLLFYLARSGNTHLVPVLDLELRARDWLDAALYARPRLKETLIGYPSLVLGSWLAHTGHRANLGWLMIGAAVSQISLVNTFEHVRSPLVLSLVRSLNGLWLGALVGLVAVVVARVLVGLLRHLQASGDDRAGVSLDPKDRRETGPA